MNFRNIPLKFQNLNYKKKDLEFKENEKKHIINYYRKNNELLSELRSVEQKLQKKNRNSKSENEDEEKELQDRKKCAVSFAINASFLVNICLFALKIIALVYSKSNSILASVVDSFLDLLAGKKKFLIFCCVFLTVKSTSNKDPSFLSPITLSRKDKFTCILQENQGLSLCIFYFML